ncbi:MAG: hypothetical protein IKR49_00125 [Clostridia bacterium]|nr:hypothetical protein [Clostridia bacterium]
MAKKQNKAPAAEPMRFSKRAFLDSSEYRHRRDLIDALLDDNQTYTLDEVKSLIERHRNERVN